MAGLVSTGSLKVARNLVPECGKFLVEQLPLPSALRIWLSYATHHNIKPATLKWIFKISFKNQICGRSYMCVCLTALRGRFRHHV